MDRLEMKMYRVFFIDYGNILTVSDKELAYVPDMFWSLPPQALPFVANCKCSASYTQDHLLKCANINIFVYTML